MEGGRGRRCRVGSEYREGIEVGVRWMNKERNKQRERREGGGDVFLAWRVCFAYCI